MKRKVEGSRLLEGINEVREEFRELKKEVEKLFSFYKWYLEDVEIDLEGSEWVQVFPLRTRLQGIFGFLLPGIAVTSGKEREYRTLARKLRNLDMELQKRRQLLRENFDFVSYREEEIAIEGVDRISKKLWWYYLDSDDVPEFTVPLWLKINQDFLKFKAVIVKGLIKGKEVNVLLFASVLPSRKQREQLEKDILLNIRYDYLTFVYNRVQDKNVDLKEYMFVLPVSGLLANLHVTSSVERSELFNRKLMVAFPRNEGVFKTKFYEELREALFKGNTKFLNRKTLREEEFDFFEVDTFIGREMRVRVMENKIRDLLQPKKENVVGDLTLVG